LYGETFKNSFSIIGGSRINSGNYSAKNIYGDNNILISVKSDSSTMAAMKRETNSSSRMLLTIFLTVAVTFSAVSLFFANFGSCGGAAMYDALESPLLAVSRMASSISSKESYGWFDDIPDEGWKLMKLRARTAVQYMNPYQPQTGYQDPIMWYLNNLQVSRLSMC
jgi:hypothetical protein